MSEQQVDLRFKAEGVHQYASGIANRSFGVISTLDLTTNTFKEIGRTELIQKSNNPQFVNSTRITYYFELLQLFKFTLYQSNTNNPPQDVSTFPILGEAEFTAQQLFGGISYGLLNLPLTRVRDGGTVSILGEHVVETDEQFQFKLSAKLQDRHWFTNLRPSILFLKLGEHGLWKVLRYRDPKITSASPEWGELKLSLQTLCNGDKYCPLIIQIYDDSNGTLIGQLPQLSVRELLRSPEKTYSLSSNGGTVTFKDASIVVGPSTVQAVSDEDSPVNDPDENSPANDSDENFLVNETGDVVEPTDVSVTVTEAADPLTVPIPLVDVSLLSIPVIDTITSGISTIMAPTIDAVVTQPAVDPDVTIPLIVEPAPVRVKRTWLDYLRYASVSLGVSIDVSGSNGNPKLPNSLHYVNLHDDTFKNTYQLCIEAVGRIVIEYDTDKRVPVNGFGGKVKDPITGVYSPVSDCFPFSKEEAVGVEGIMDLYKKTMKNVMLSGPTNLATVIRTATNHAIQAAETHLNYTIQLIITDGDINDMSKSIDAIIDASPHPISFIIMGVGSGDFTNMHILDGDDALLSQNGKTAERDIVQFVHFEPGMNPTILAQEVLHEIPTQLEEYYHKLEETHPERFAT
eukprot:CAMPEP_0173145834 /NCGR_PEP_ID=MMETSP1105-20130129/8128_1 /TAXON_ID=2985 /ORGANISM="Ochromonas sp., Strain BG-1" /LENGTH=627 /DNA_ID=CAMNT_0014059909 /DNA_START=85 /DNA_END=1968 /DNA_ORIENTATION=-